MYVGMSALNGMAYQDMNSYEHTRRIEHEPGKQLKETRHRTDFPLCL